MVMKLSNSGELGGIVRREGGVQSRIVTQGERGSGEYIGCVYYLFGGGRVRRERGRHFPQT